jgi:two-component system osmolarity sensor histidine kinase EnvZ
VKAPRFRLPALGNPFNTLFGRMVVLMVVLLIADHSVWLITFGRVRPHDHFDQAQREILLAVSVLRQLDVQAPNGAPPDPALQTTLRAALQGVKRVPINAPDTPPVSGQPRPIPPDSAGFSLHPIPPADEQGFKPSPIPPDASFFKHGPMPPGAAGLQRSLLLDLPPGSKVAIRPPPMGQVWVLLPGSLEWDVIPLGGPPQGAPLTSVFIELGLAVLFSIIAAWQLQKPLTELARAAAKFRPYRAPVALRERGPREVKRVIRHFNDTLKELHEIEQDREVMLAGVAHDLRAPITRIRARAEVIAETRIAAGFIRDADSLTQIVGQFLDFSKLSVDESPPRSVDEFCQAQWNTQENDVQRSAEIQLSLKAGPEFALPVIDIERILSNLVENALTYGVGPIEIQTRRVSEARADMPGETSVFWELSVRDHGAGIPDRQLSTVTRPFVRLDASRGGDAHCGLGLAIVNKLAQRHAGMLSLSNAPDGGLRATLRFAV